MIYNIFQIQYIYCIHVVMYELKIECFTIFYILNKFLHAYQKYFLIDLHVPKIIFKQLHKNYI
jgi:hypothetical protein